MKYKLPKMRYKGSAIETQRIRVDKKPLVTEIKDVTADEPTFALRTSKAPEPQQQQQQGQQQGQPSGSGFQFQQQSKPGQAASSSGRGGGAASSTGSAVASAATAFKLVGSVECHGRPVEAMSLSVALPPVLQQQLKQQSNQQQQQGAGVSWNMGALQTVGKAVRLDVCGRDVFVGAPGCQELRVPLPFAGSVQVSVVCEMSELSK